jgi:hypothetical protein
VGGIEQRFCAYHARWSIDGTHIILPASCAERVAARAARSVGAAIFYRPKDKAVHADNARINFARGGGGDQITLLRCYNEWAETDFSTQWCFENYVQARWITSPVYPRKSAPNI